MNWPFSVTNLEPPKGEMEKRMRFYDWSRTPLGPIDRWPISLKITVRVVLDCKLPMYLAWGRDFIQFFNDAYLPILGDKHAAALGNDARVTWNEIWPTIGPMWERVLQGEPVGFDDYKLTINRFGYLEDCYFNFSYSPVPDDTGAICGVLVTFAETTKKVFAEKRQSFQLQLADALHGQNTSAELIHTASRLAGEYFLVDRAGYAHIDEQRQLAEVEYDWTNGNLPALSGESWPLTWLGTTVIEELRRGITLAVADVNVDARTESGSQGYAATGIRAFVTVPFIEEGRLRGIFKLHCVAPRRWTEEEITLAGDVARRTGDALRRARAEAELKDETRILELLNKTGQSLTSTLDLDALLQTITDAGTQLAGAHFGSFFYNGRDTNGDALMLYTLSGAPREAFEKLGHPRATPVFSPTFHGHVPVRSDDITKDPRYGKMAPHHGMPKGHLPVRSYLAASVVSKSGAVLGGLFFGHSQPGVFTERTERIIAGIAAQAAIAIDNARLYESSRKSAEEREGLLANERAARADAERLIRSKDEFLAMLAHELRNPLAPVSAAAEILKLAGHDEKGIRQASDIISRQVGHLTHLIDDLMDVSRVTRGLVQLEKENLDVKTLIATAVEQARPLIEARGHVLTTRIEAETAVVFGDRMRLVQVIANLLNNATKYSPVASEITLRLETSEERISISVIDNGNGIEASLLPHVFDLFTQGTRGLDRSAGGLGIGLALVKAIVSLHDGVVTARSAGLNMGSTFTVSLPQIYDKSAGDAPESEMLIPGSFHVMVVDDNIDAAHSLAVLLKALGYQVSVKANAKNALAEAAAHPPQAFILDIGLPDMTGYELAKQLREVEGCKDAFCIALTGYGQPQDREMAKIAGFDHYLIKPANVQLLTRILADVGARNRSTTNCVS